MDLQKVKINDTVYECFTATYFNSDFDAILKTDDIDKVKSDFSKIDEIIIMNGSGLVVNKLISYKEIKSITELPNYYGDDSGNLYSAIEIVIKKMDITEELQKLEDKINNVIDISFMSVDEYRSYYKNNLSEICRNTIYNGTDVETEYGLEHFTFDDNDQRNIDSSFTAAYATGLSQFYHPSTTPTTPCRLYSASDIIQIYATMKKFILYHTTYTNQLYTLLDNCTDKDAIQAIVYGVELPKENQDILDSAMSNLDTVINTMLRTISEHNSVENDNIETEVES